jgi:ABC-type Fe3+ transport system permease subunit
MDNYQGTHKRAYKNFHKAGQVLLPIGIGVSAGSLTTFVTFLVLFILEVQRTGGWKELATLYYILFMLSIVLFALGMCALIPGIVFTSLAHGFRSHDEENGISYSEFND